MMEICCNSCCPQPKNSVIFDTGMAKKCRQWIKGIMITEVVVCILHMMIFDILSGFTHSISVWIDFIAYSTMSWCQCIVLIIVTCMDLGMMSFSYAKSPSYQYTINSHWVS